MSTARTYALESIWFMQIRSGKTGLGNRDVINISEL